MPDDQRADATRVPGSDLPVDGAHHVRETGVTAPSVPGHLDAQPVASSADAWSRAWVVVILVLVLAATIAVFLDLPSPIRPVATIAFVLLGPGIAIARLLRLDSHLAEFTLGFALSVAIAGLVTGTILYLGMWSPTRALVILAVIALAALALDPNLVPRTAWRQLWHAGRGRARFLAGMAASPEHEGTPQPESGSPATVPSPVTPAAGASPLAAPALRPAVAGDTLPPPPVAIIRRGPRRAPVAVQPTRSGRRRQALGENPLEESDVSRGLRTTIDEMIDDLAERKDVPPT